MNWERKVFLVKNSKKCSRKMKFIPMKFQVNLIGKTWFVNCKVDLDENETIELINQLGENKKFSSENQFNLEELLIKSRQLNSSKSLRLIDQQIESLPKKISSSIESINLSGNVLNKNEKIQWKDLSKQIQVKNFFNEKFVFLRLIFSIWNYRAIFSILFKELKLVLINYKVLAFLSMKFLQLINSFSMKNGSTRKKKLFLNEKCFLRFLGQIYILSI